MNILLRLLMTAGVYCIIPLVLASKTKKQTTAKSYRLKCYLLNLCIFLVFFTITKLVYGQSSPASAYFIWTTIFSAIGVSKLKQKNYIDTEPSLNGEESSAVEEANLKHESFNVSDSKKRYCKNCGSEINEYSFFCKNCGCAVLINRNAEGLNRIIDVEEPTENTHEGAIIVTDSVEEKTDVILADEIQFCHKCGYKLKVGSAFCSRCGAQI